MHDPLDGLLLLPRLRVEDANAISGPLTWGFPAPSAFTGFVHALNRRLGEGHSTLDGVGIICHQFVPQVYQPEGKYLQYFRLARHPVEKDGTTSSIVEEGRAHMEVSLLIGVRGYLDAEAGRAFAQQVQKIALSMRMAGGRLLPVSAGKRHEPTYTGLTRNQAGDVDVFRSLRRRLLPGFALVGRHEVLRDYWAKLREQRPEATALDALLDLTALHFKPTAGEDAQSSANTPWETARVRPGWLVPIPIGYGALSPLHPPGVVQNTRDETTPFRFVESLYSLGEWISPHLLTHPHQLLWHHRADPDAGLYLCTHNSVTL